MNINLNRSDRGLESVSTRHQVTSIRPNENDEAIERKQLNNQKSIIEHLRSQLCTEDSWSQSVVISWEMNESIGQIVTKYGVE